MVGRVAKLPPIRPPRMVYLITLTNALHQGRRDTFAGVLRIAQGQGAIPYDIPDVELSHVGDLCSFDAFLSEYALGDPALHQLAAIVRGADTSRLDLMPQSAGLYALSLGLSRNHLDDHEVLRHGMVMCDALYAWCGECQRERHQWPPAA